MAKVKDVEAMVSSTLYEEGRKVGSQDLEQLKARIEGIKAEQFARGALQKIKYDNAHNRMIWYAILYNLKQNRAYLDAGMNWEEFCESVGEPRRTLEGILADLRPLFEEFTAEAAGLTGVPFNKIRLLGRSLPAGSAALQDGALIIDGETIPLDAEHRDDLEAAIDALADRQKKALEEKDGIIKAKDRHLAEKEKVIVKQEKDLAKLTRSLEARGFKPGEEEFCDEIEKLRTAFGIIAGKLDPESVADFVDPERGGTERAKAEYLGLVQGIASYSRGLLSDAKLIFQDPELEPGWTPPAQETATPAPANGDTTTQGDPEKPGLSRIK